ncbi:MAG: DUF992 domain-containing protein [Acidimicrobiia bacterium]|nr:DUF992 domain-containing protein [Acidimicrobiia bacterium]
MKGNAMKTIVRNLSVAALALLALAFAPGAAPAADPGVRLGMLACEAVPGTRFNLLIMSSVDVKCEFADVNGCERYRGETGIALGADLNLKGMEKITFAVLAATSDYKIGSYALAGKYLGAKASASLGVGGGAAVLLGGGAKNFSLQPVALEGNIGLGAAAGLGYLYIEPERK